MRAVSRLPFVWIPFFATLARRRWKLIAWLVPDKLMMLVIIVETECSTQKKGLHIQQRIKKKEVEEDERGQKEDDEIGKREKNKTKTEEKNGRKR